MPRVGRRAKRQQARHIATPIDVFITPASDDDNDEDMIHSRFNHVPVLLPFAEPIKSPTSIFDLPGQHKMVNPAMALPYFKLVTRSCHIEFDEFYNYFRCIYRYIRQSLFDILPMNDHDVIDAIGPDTFAVMCLVIAKIRVKHINGVLSGTDFEFPEKEITTIELPNSVAGPINSIGCVTTGPNYTLTIPKYEDPRHGILYAFCESMRDDSMGKLVAFVALAKRHKIVKTSTLSLSMGGTVWWMLHNTSHPRHIDAIRNVYPHFSNVPETAIQMALKISPLWSYDFSRPVLRSYWLQASKTQSVRDHLAFDIL